MRMQRCSISAVRGYSAWSMKLRCRFVGDDLLRLGLHPGRHEGRQVTSRVTFECEVLGHQSQRVLSRNAGLRELPARNLLGNEPIAEQRYIGGRRLDGVGHVLLLFVAGHWTPDIRETAWVRWLQFWSRTMIEDLRRRGRVRDCTGPVG